MNSFRNKAVAAALAVTTVAWMLPVAGAQTTADLQAQIQDLLAKIAVLQAQLGTVQGGTVAFSYTRDLTVGSTGDDVKSLQSMLISKGYLKIAAPTGYFGALTKAALAAYQSAGGISPAVGYFGPITRAFVASSTTTGGTTTGGTTTGGTTTGGVSTGACTAIGEGSIVVNLAATPAGNSNAQTGTKVPVYGISIKAVNSDMVVDRVNLALAVTNGATTYKPSSFITKITAWDGSTELTSVDVNDTTLNTDSAYVYSVSVGGMNFKVPKDTIKVLTFSVNTISQIDNNRTVAVYEYGSNSMRAHDCGNLSVYDSSLNSTTYQRSHTFKSGGASALSLAVASDNPVAKNIWLDASAGATDVEMLRFVATAATADATLLTLGVSSSFVSLSPTTFKLYDSAGTLLASAATSTGNDSVIFTNVNAAVPVGNKTFVIKGDFPTIPAGAGISASVAIDAAGASLFRKADGTTAAPTVSSAILSNGVHAYRAAAILEFVSAAVTKTPAQVSGASVMVSSTADATFVFKATARGGSLTLPTAAMFTIDVVSGAAATIEGQAAGTPAITVSNNKVTNISDGDTVTTTVTAHLISSADGISGSGGAYFKIKLTNFNWLMVGSVAVDNTWGLGSFKTPDVFLP